MSNGDVFKHNMCTKKRAYETRREAAIICRKMRKTGSKGIRPYLCHFCGHWHNGHWTPSKLDNDGLIIDDI